MTAPRGQLRAWRTDRLDADNFLTVPELGLAPQGGTATWDADYPWSSNPPGFSRPLVYPGANWYQARKDGREILSVARKLLRRSIQSREQFYLHLDGYWQSEDHDRPPTALERVAVLYEIVSQALDRVFIHGGASEEHLISHLASAGALVSTWALEGDEQAIVKVAAAAAQRQEAARQYRGAAAGVSDEDVAAFALTAGYPDGIKFEVLCFDAAEHFGISERTIARRIQKARANFLMP